MLKITDVDALPNAKLRITLNNGSLLHVNLADYLDAPGYESLRDPAIFARVQVDEWGHGVEWPQDVGIPVSALYRLAREQAGSAWPTEKFNAWMRRNALSAATAARALGLTRRTIIYYHTGQKPIPLVVGLACDGFDARLRSVPETNASAFSVPARPPARAATG